MKFINDVLKQSDKFSIKRLIIIITFLFVLLLGTFIVISDKILDKEVNRYAIDIFNSLLLFLFSLLGISEATKKITDKNVPEENP